MGTLLVGLAFLVLLISLGIPIAICFGFLALLLIVSFDVSSAMLIPTAFSQVKSVVLLAIPFFILIGNLMSTGGLASRLIDFVNSIAGRIRGGLGAVTVIACALFGSIGGSCSAAVAAVGTIAIPKLEENGYPRSYATALVACSSILGQLIPPSIPGIIYALLTYQSIPACWLATVGPGVLTVVLFCIINKVMTRKMDLAILPPADFKTKVKEFTVSSKKAALALLLPVLLLGSIYGGIATPTESACLGVIYVIFVSRYAHKEIDWKGVGESMVGAATTTGALILMLFFIMINTRILIFEQIPQEMTKAILSISDNKFVILLIINLFLIALGMIVDDISGTALAASLLTPVVVELGVHPVHFAAILGINLGMGNITPPTAPILYLAGHIGKCGLADYFKPTMVFIIFGLIPAILATTYWEDLPLFLPRLFGLI